MNGLLRRHCRRNAFLYTTGVMVGILALAYWYVTSPPGGVLSISDVRLALTGGWWAMLGGVAISYKGIADHQTPPEWNASWLLWYLMRPFSAFVVGLVTFAILQVANTQSPASVPVLAVAAFTFGTQERRFFDFLYQVAGLIFTTSADQAGSIQVTSFTPTTGSAGQLLIIDGKGFQTGATATVGGQQLTQLVVSPDGTSIAGLVPAGLGSGMVDVTVTNPDHTARRAPSQFNVT